jgi:hypothetical protein
MRIILSRKGFDSASGGILSPIFNDKTMISFPIPSDDEDKFEDLVFGELSYSTILNDLNYKGKNTCHVDPDLTLGRRKKSIENWYPIFGQSKSAASYLLKNVEIGDIFLFFGNYHFVEKINEIFKYVHHSDDFYKDNDLQVIWGYMEVGEIVTKREEQEKYSWHPHSHESLENKPNAMFIGAEKLSFNSSIPGAGLLSFDRKRVLTKFDSNKATWIKRPFFDIDSVIGNRKNSAKDPVNEIYYKGRWQELVLKESLECEEWAKEVIED